MVLEGRLHNLQTAQGAKIPVQPEYPETLQIFLLQFRQLGPAGKQPPDWEETIQCFSVTWA